MPVIDPYTEIAAALEQIILTEFEDEGFPVFHDRLHESLGWEGTRIGISPESQRPMSGNELVLDTEVLIQFYGRFNKEVDPKQVADPRIITGYAARLRHALQTTAAQGTSSVWYFKLLTVEYPRDPTGNKTRFEARVQAKGNNIGLLETVG